ncbi:MAG TPA: bifunctional 4-hydroxy-2-oxoglutarate aldolase/2-dehydro-3-deoxy-phosphogluconate aldolase [Candidatus Limnocylindrales bacterium]|nr:bifunctional 4-hydroxy-2-oxoglutarate aldolase/2-dehydro-3-deoxy-phosphogluconate aldolase [Candidatus Limnocylindrales bacterium]
MASPIELRAGDVASAIRTHRLVAVLRRIEPRSRLLDLVGELAEDGIRIFEITFDAPSAEDDLIAVARATTGSVVGAGTIRTVGQARSAVDAGAAFAVSPILDPAVVAAALGSGLPFIPGAATPTEADAAWRAGATFVKLFPASSLGPSFVRELRGPLPEIETIVTGGADAANARAFLEAGAVAVGIGSALTRMDRGERRDLVAWAAGR